MRPTVVTLFLCFVVASMLHSLVIETADFGKFLYGNTTACAYDNWISHVSEGIADEGYNYYAPYDIQNNDFGDFLLPDNDQLTQWGSVIYQLLQQDWDAAQNLLDAYGFPYEVVQFNDTQTGKTYYLLREILNMAYQDDNGTATPADDEIGGFDYGWGLYLFNPQATHPIIITAPHPTDDFITPAMAYEGLKAWDAMFMLISGAGREVLWTNSGSYTNSKSLCDPSRREAHPFNVAYQRFADYIRQTFDHRELSIQIHSYDWNRHANHPSCQVSAGNGRSCPNLPIRDLSQSHLDMINAAPQVIHPAQSIGNNAEVRLNDYYGVNYNQYEFIYTDGMREFPVSNHVDLPGYSQNRQMVYTDNGWNNYDVFEPFFHLEMDELPNSYEQTEENLNWFYGYDALFEMWDFDSLFVHTLAYYTPWIQHLKTSVEATFIMNDGLTPGTPQNFAITSHQFNRIGLSWEPVSSYDFETYEILYSTLPIYVGNYDILTRNQIPSLANQRATNIVITGLENNQRYYFMIRARDNNGNTSFPSQEINAFTAPAQLADFVAIGMDNAVMLHWVVGEEAGNIGYRILRGDGVSGELEEIASWQTNSGLMAQTGQNTTYTYTDQTAQNNYGYRYKLAMDTYHGEQYEFETQRQAAPKATYDVRVSTTDGAITDKFTFGTNQFATNNEDDFYDYIKPPHGPEPYIQAAIYEPGWSPQGVYLQQDIMADFNPLSSLKSMYLRVKTSEVNTPLTISLPEDFTQKSGECYIRSLSTGSFSNITYNQFVFELPDTNYTTFFIYWGRMEAGAYFYSAPHRIYQAGDTLHVAWNYNYPFLVERCELALFNGTTYENLAAFGGGDTRSFDYIIPDGITIYNCRLRLRTYTLDDVESTIISAFRFSILPSAITLDAAAGWSLQGSPFPDASYFLGTVFNPDAQLFSYTPPTYNPVAVYGFDVGYWLHQSQPSSRTISDEIYKEIYAHPLQHGWNLVPNPHMLTYQMKNLRFNLDNHEYSFQSMLNLQKVPPVVMTYADGHYLPATEIPPASSFLLWYDGESTEGCQLVLSPYMTNENINIQPNAWDIALEFQQPSSDMDAIILGVNSTATTQFDFDLDLPALPDKPFTDRILAWFTPQDSTSRYDALYQDILFTLNPDEPDEVTWDAFCNVPTNEMVMVTPRFTDIPSLYNVQITWNGEPHILQNNQPLNLTVAQPGTTDFTITVNNGIAAMAESAIACSNFPNPFNPTTTISFRLPENLRRAKVEIYNIRGQRVKTLISEEAASNLHRVVWNGTNTDGKGVASGIYFYRIQAENYSKTQRMLLLK